MGATMVWLLKLAGEAAVLRVSIWRRACAFSGVQFRGRAPAVDVQSSTSTAEEELLVPLSVHDLSWILMRCYYNMRRCCTYWHECASTGDAWSSEACDQGRQPEPF